jgi:hypothetical protein
VAAIWARSTVVKILPENAQETKGKNPADTESARNAVETPDKPGQGGHVRIIDLLL